MKVALVLCLLAGCAGAPSVETAPTHTYIGTGSAPVPAVNCAEVAKRPERYCDTERLRCARSESQKLDEAKQPHVDIR